MLSFGDAPGNLFNQLGKLGLLVSEADTYMNAQETNLIDTTNGAVAQYNAMPDIQALIGQSYIGLLNSTGSAVGSLVTQVAAQTVNRQVFEDNPRISQTLQSLNTLASLQEVIRQMNVAGATILAATITATPQSFSLIGTNAGNGVLVASVQRPLDGRVLENSFAETLQVVCTADSYVGGATAGNETLTVTGTGAETNLFAFDWPLGSNAQSTINAINGSADNTSGNLLTNSSWDNWTSSLPDNWVIEVGTGGTDIVENSGISYDGVASLQIIGDGSTLLQWTQQFDDATDGTAGSLDPLTQYAINVFVLRDGVAPAAGVLRIALIDENDNMILDEGGNPNSFTIDLTSLAPTWTSYTGVFRTPLILPTTIRLQFTTTTPLTTGRSVFFDKCGLGEMTQLYTSGPYLAAFAGNQNFAQGDYTYVPVTNSRGAAGTLNTFQTLLARLFASLVYPNELLFPSSPVPTISDGLIG